MYEKVYNSLMAGEIVGVDYTSIDDFFGGKTRVHIWVYSNRNRFLPILSYECSLRQNEVIELINSFGGKLWMHDDDYPDITSGVKVRYLSAVEPCGCTFIEANKNL